MPRALLLLLALAGAARADGFAEDLDYGGATLAEHLSRLRDKDADQLAASRAILANAGHESWRAAPAVLMTVKHAPPEARARLADALGRMGPRAVPALTAALHFDDLDIRLAAALALFDIGTAARTAIPALRNVADNTPRDALKAACRAALHSAAGDTPAVARLASDAPHLLLALAARRPALLDADALAPHLPTLLSHWHDAARRDGRRLALLAGSPRPLLALLDAPAPRVRLEAIEALGEMGGAAAVPALSALARKGAAATRAAACRALGRIGDPAAVDALRDALRAGGDAAEEAALALARLGPAAAPAVPQLITALGDAHPHAARAALARIGKDAVPALIALLKGDDEFLRGQAVRALREMGPPASAAIDALESARAAAKGRLDADAFAAFEAMGSAGVAPLLKAGTEAAIASLGRLGPLALPAADKLARVLTDRAAAERRAILRAIGEIGPPATLPELPEAPLGAQTLEALSRLRIATKPAREFATTSLTAGQARERLAALRYLAAVGGSADLLADTDADVRTLSAELLLLDGKADAVAGHLKARLRGEPDAETLRLAAWTRPRAAVDALRTTLRTADGELRELAAHALLRIDPADADARTALLKLLKTLADADPRDVNAGALRTLFDVVASQTSRAKEFVPALLPLLSPKRPLPLRLSAAWALGAFGAGAALAAPDMLAVLATVGIDFEETALLFEDIAAGRVRDDLPAWTISPLVDEESLPRLAAPLAAMRARREGAVADMRAALSSARAAVEGRVADAILRLGPAGITAASDALAAERTHLRRAAASLLLHAGDAAKPARDALRAALEDADALTAARCATALARHGDRAALPALLRCLSEDAPAAAQALAGLEALNDPGGLPAVACAARRPEPEARAAAVRALTRADLIRPFLRDLSPEVRIAACRALMKLDRTFDPLPHLPDDIEPALDLIAEQGEPARPLAGKVRGLMLTGRPSVAIAAALALHRIRGDVVLPRERLAALVEMADLRPSLRLRALDGLRTLGGKHRHLLARLLNGTLPPGPLRDAAAKMAE